MFDSKQYAAEYRKRNADKARAYQALYRVANREKMRAYSTEYRKINAVRLAEDKKEWAAKRAEELKAYRRTPEYRAKRLARYKERYMTEPEFRLKAVLRSSLAQALGYKNVRKCASVLKLIGCSLSEFIRHLEAQLVPGMSWDNHGEWHIDHIRPCASFDLTDPAKQAECFHYSNLRPLWAEDNLRKGAKYV